MKMWLKIRYLILQIWMSAFRQTLMLVSSFVITRLVATIVHVEMDTEYWIKLIVKTSTNVNQILPTTVSKYATTLLEVLIVPVYLAILYLNGAFVWIMMNVQMVVTDVTQMQLVPILLAHIHAFVAMDLLVMDITAQVVGYFVELMLLILWCFY